MNDDSCRTVWRFELEPFNDTEISLPRGAEVVDFDMNNLWALVDPDIGPGETRTFHVVGTGTSWRDRHFRYLKTCHQVVPNGNHYVWHLLERR